MSSKSGGLVEIDDFGKLVRSASNADPAFADEGLLPYSLAILPKIDRVLLTNSPMVATISLVHQLTPISCSALSDLKLLGTYRLDSWRQDVRPSISPEEARVPVPMVRCTCRPVMWDSARDRPGERRRRRHLVHMFPGAFCGVPTIVGHYLGPERARDPRLYRARHRGRHQAGRSLAVDDQRQILAALDRMGSSVAPPRGHVGAAGRPDVPAQAGRGDRAR